MDVEEEIAATVRQVTDTRKREPMLVEREKTHGDFRITAHVAQGIKRAFRTLATNDRITKEQHEALDMIATKIARILSGDPLERDHWDDIAGYAKLGSEACE